MSWRRIQVGFWMRYSKSRPKHHERSTTSHVSEDERHAASATPAAEVAAAEVAAAEVAFAAGAVEASSHGCSE
jgi:hypothetical protein